MLQYLVKAVGDYLKSPAFKRTMIQCFRMAVTNPGVQNEIKKTVEIAGESVIEFFSTINIKITHRKDETKFIIDASAKINYSANNVSNGKVIQGEYITDITDITVNNYIIVNNFQVPLFNHSKEDIKRIEEIQQMFNETLNKCIREKNSSIEIKSVINSDYIELNKELVKKLSKITDYSMLQKALGTED